MPKRTKPPAPNESPPESLTPPSVGSGQFSKRKPMPHADSPKVVADSGESWVASTHTLPEAEAHGHTITEAEHAALKKNWRCLVDGHVGQSDVCPVCGHHRPAASTKEIPE